MTPSQRVQSDELRPRENTSERNKSPVFGLHRIQQHTFETQILKTAPDRRTNLRKPVSAPYVNCSQGKMGEAHSWVVCPTWSHTLAVCALHLIAVAQPGRAHSSQSLCHFTATISRSGREEAGTVYCATSSSGRPAAQLPLQQLSIHRHQRLFTEGML
ncbi:unnamed protein product [Pleuronectes platessa]|uniref:Uncharacterized protein n=1 Tax=Pleuronectes platessa TaxID=8262 RepID=A0A9N7VUC0_PLEPL|nr:unnamed protein product [Pleuronectes platessa]